MRAPNRTPRGKADPAAFLRASARHARRRNRAMERGGWRRLTATCPAPYPIESMV